MSLPLIILLAGMLLIPFTRLLMIVLESPERVGAFVETPANLKVLRTTFIDALIVTLLSLGLGAVLAWTVRTTRSRTMRLLVLIATLVPFWMGSVVKLYAFTVILQTNGIVNKALIKVGVIDHPLDLLYNELAVIVGMTYQMLPYSVLPLYVAFASVDEDLLLAAQGLGAARWRALTGIAMPLATPGILATATIVYVISIGFYLTPVVLGGVTAPFSASLIAQDVFLFFDIPSAAITAVFLLAGGLLVVGTGYLVVGRERLRRALG